MARKSLKARLSQLIAAGFFMTAAVPVFAQPIACASHDEIVAWLQENFAEKALGYGLVENHTLIEIHASPGGTWTILTTDVHGRSCMLVAGHSWTPIEQPPGGPTETRLAEAEKAASLGLEPR